MWPDDRVPGRRGRSTHVRCLHARLLLTAHPPFPLLHLVLLPLRMLLARLLLQLLVLCLLLLLLLLRHVRVAPVQWHLVAWPLEGPGPHVPMCKFFFSVGARIFACATAAVAVQPLDAVGLIGL